MAIIKEIEGDIFDTPPNSVLIQACNAKGVWGAGVAAAFKQTFPSAFVAYKRACTKPPAKVSLANHQHSLLGTCILTSVGHESEPSIPEGSYYHIVSLITSYGYGKTRSSVADILQNTASTMQALKAELADLEAKGLPVGGVYAVKINSGLFRVPWEETMKILQEGEVDTTIVTPPSEEEDDASGDPSSVAEGIEK